MEKIQTCLWFDSHAEEAAKFYCSVFANSKIVNVSHYGKAGAEAAGRPEGSVLVVDFELEGVSFLALNGGPHFRPNPAISFFVACATEKELNALWKKLAQDVRMGLQEYPWAKKYGWCQDKFGVNWQLMLGSRLQKIAPALLFANARFGKAEEAIRFYAAQFPGASIERIEHDPTSKAVLHAAFTLGGLSFVGMEGPLEHTFDFTPGTSFVLHCDSQEEIDAMWSRLSAVPEAEQCGWLQDKFGVSWQVVHKEWSAMMSDPDARRRDRAMSAILKMKKPDVAVLREAFR